MRQPKRKNCDQLYDDALRALAGRAFSTGELRVRLARKALCPADVDTVLQRLKESGYLNDVRFAENFAAARLENEGLGRARVLRDLRQRRVAPALAGTAVDSAYREADEAALVERYLARKFRGKDLAAYLSEEKNLAAAYRRLRYAGFSARASIDALKRHAAQAAALDTDALESVEETEPENPAAQSDYTSE